MFADAEDNGRVPEPDDGELQQRLDRRRPVSLVELAKRPSLSWLIDGITFQSSVALFAGKKATFKTFVLLGMALCVALGLAWQGRATKRGVVVYLAAEGGRGLIKRARAWCKSHERELGDLAGHFLVITHPYKLNHPEDVEEMIASIRALGVEPVLIVIDTLARTIHGDENESAVMRAYIDGCDKLKDEFHAAIWVIHHVGKTGRSPRGSSVSECDADTVILLERTAKQPSVKVSCDKQKDEDEFEPFGLDRVVVHFGEDEYGPADKSCVMRLSASIPGSTKKAADPHRPHRKVCAAIARHNKGDGCSKKDAMVGYSSEKSFYRHLKNGIEAGLAEEFGNTLPLSVRLTPAGRAVALSGVSPVSDETRETRSSQSLKSQPPPAPKGRRTVRHERADPGSGKTTGKPRPDRQAEGGRG